MTQTGILLDLGLPAGTDLAAESLQSTGGSVMSYGIPSKPCPSCNPSGGNGRKIIEKKQEFDKKRMKVVYTEKFIMVSTGCRTCGGSGRIDMHKEDE